LVTLVVFLKVKSDNTANLTARLKLIDWLGNLIFVLSMVSVLIALSWAGSKYPWSSFHIIVPLVMGFLGGVLFMFYEASHFCVNPTMPIHLFSNRTSGTAFVLTFLHSLAGISVIYFLPVYFQGVLAATPGRAGIDLLPTILFLLPFAITAGGLLSKFGRYRPLQHIGFAMMVIGFGLLSLLKANSTTAQWVGYLRCRHRACPPSTPPCCASIPHRCRHGPLNLDLVLHQEFWPDLGCCYPHSCF